jgi:hypothetical protein
MKKNKKEIKKEKRYFIDIFCDFMAKLGFKLFKMVVTLIIGAFYGAYTIIEAIFEYCIETIKKLPKMVKITLFYIPIIAITILILKPRTIEKYIGFETIKEQEVTKYVYIDDKTCKMDKYSCMIYLVGKEYGLTDEQSLMTVAISIHETGKYTSDAFKNKNNVGGVFKNGQLATYNSLEEGINAFINNLKKNYFDQGLDTIEKIQKKYCPIGAENDPKGVNVYWLPSVTKYYNELITTYLEK